MTFTTTCAPGPACLVSVEGLPGGPRDAVLRGLLARGAGLAHVPDAPWPASPDFATSCAELLRRSRAWRLAGAPAAPAAVDLGAWLPYAPRDRLLAGVYARLAGDLLPAGARHVMLRLHSNPHEAFDAAVDAGPDAKDLDLRALFAAAADLATRADAGLGLPTAAYDLVAPPHAADVPHHAARLVESAAAALAAEGVLIA